MDCLALAEKLANKKRITQAPMAPVSHKRAAIMPRVLVKPENVDSQNENGDQKKKTCFLQTKPGHQYIPNIKTVLTDKNLNRYFKRFLTERKLDSVLTFIETVEIYKKDFPSQPDKQVKAHRNMVEQLGTLPASFLQVATSAKDAMSGVSSTSFDTCGEALLKALDAKEYKQFVETPLFTKWTLKYHNTEEATKNG